MDWGNIKNVLTSKLREAEIGLDKFVRNRTPIISKKKENDSQLNDKEILNEEGNISNRYSYQNNMNNGDLAQLKSRYLLAKKILDDKVNQIEEKKKYIEKLKSLTKYIRNGIPLTIDEILQEFSTELASVENKYKKVLKERDKLKKELQMHIDTTNIEDLDAEIEKLKEEEISLQNKSVLLDEKVIKLKEELDHEESILNDLKLKYNKYCQENTELDEKISSLKDENKRNLMYIDNINESIKSSSSQLEDLQKKCKELDTQTNHMQLTFEKAEKEKAELKEKLENQRKEHEIEINNLKASLEENINKQINELKLAHELNGKVLKDEIDELTNNIKEEKDKIKDLENENYKMIEKLEIELETLELQNNDLSNQSLLENRPLLKQIHELQFKITEKNEEIQRKREFYNSKINEIEDDEYNARTYFEEISSEYRKIEDQISRYNNKVHIYQENVLILKEKLNYLLNDEKNLKDEHQSLQQILEEKNKSIEKLNEEIEQLNNDLNTLNKEIEDFESSLFNIRRNNSSSDSLDQSPNRIDNNTYDESSKEEEDPLQIKIKNIDKEINEIINQINQSKLEYNELELKYVNLYDNKKNNEIRLQNLKQKMKDLDELEQRHNVTLELLGEKAEIEEQLIDDMEEWKTMYKQQIDVLKAQIESLKK